jgi:hypothetical protein
VQQGKNKTLPIICRIMGRAKEDDLKYYSMGYSKPPKKYVCKNHFTDDSIIEYIEKESEDGICSYCRLKYQDGKVITLEALIDFINNGIRYFYGEPGNEGVNYDSSEGGWFGTTVFDSYELLQDEISLEIDNNNLFEDIHNSFIEYQWCITDPYMLPEHQELSYDWNRFCEIVKHKSRYSFFATKAFDFLSKTISQILHDIAHGVESLDLIHKIHVNTELYRCRQHSENENPSTFEDLTSPPIKYCDFANRMSPAGISMFYGAFDYKTSILEVVDKKQLSNKPNVTMGVFNVTKELFVVDFTKLPPIPSIFDKVNRKKYYKILFFHSFVDDLSKEFKRENKTHIEYIPTQVLTEYFRYVFPEYSNIELDGIIYKSSKNSKGKCCVLFLDNEESIKYLELKTAQKETMPCC